jgi:IclR family transcriptional regulator, acetate operon repressor
MLDEIDVSVHKVDTVADGGPTAARAVDKALATVEVLLRSPEPASAREIAERAGVNRTTAHRLLNALIRRGWAEKLPGTAGYRLNLRFLALARLALAGRDFAGEVRPAMERLADLSRETVHLGVLDGMEVVHVDRVDSPEMVGVASRVGTRAVPHVTALGKALLACGPEAALAAYLAHARALPPPHRLDDGDRLLADLRRVRERGFSLDDEESSAGIRCLGVPILGAAGEPLFALSITGPSARFTAERALACAPAAREAARALSIQFGWPAPLGPSARAAR